MNLTLPSSEAEKIWIPLTKWIPAESTDVKLEQVTIIKDIIRGRAKLSRINYVAYSSPKKLA